MATRNPFSPVGRLRGAVVEVQGDVGDGGRDGVDERAGGAVVDEPVGAVDQQEPPRRRGAELSPAKPEKRTKSVNSVTLLWKIVIRTDLSQFPNLHSTYGSKVVC